MKAKIYLPVLLALVSSAVGCKTRNVPMPPPEAAEVPPAGYAQPGDEIPMPPEQGGRFGYTGQEKPAPPATNSAPRPGERDVRDMAPSSGPSVAEKPAPKKEEKPTPPPSSGPPPSSEMPFANPVAGDPLVVTLPGKNASLGKISIEKLDSSGSPTGEPLSRGTQVQIPDPNNPGQKIYFKVP